jgi:signal transduction histidine kinase
MRRFTAGAWGLPIAIAVAGIVAAWLAAMAANMSLAEALRLTALLVGTGAVAAGLGFAVLLPGRRWSIRTQISVIALLGICVVVVGALVAAKAMFLSDHDLQTLTVVLVVGATVALLTGMVLGRRIVAGDRALRENVRQIGRGAESPHAPGSAGSRPGVVHRRGPRVSVGSTPATAETAALQRDLADMERRLESARARERAAEESRRELVAWVSHDLRTPLAGIRAVVEALSDGVLANPEEVRDAYLTLGRESARLAGLIDDLFELSVIQAGAFELHVERASLGDLVSDAVAAARIPARARGVKVEGRLRGPVPDMTLAPSAVARVLRNLLENAVRHTPHDGAVVVEAGMEGRSAYVAVQDGCGGIPAPDLSRVFDPTFRGEPARTPRADGGAGLGLAIAKGIVEAHDGDIRVWNEAPGCRFVLRLPMTATR